MWYARKLTEHKCLEIDLTCRLDWSLGIHAEYRTRCDHPGFYFSLHIFGLCLEIVICDNRHLEDM